MDEILYLEPDEEITSVVDKLKGLESKSVGLVAPKGSTIVQSLVSLKLLKKQAQELGKKIAIVTSDEVGQNLASRIGLPVYSDVRSQTPIVLVDREVPQADKPIEIDMTEKQEKAPEAEKEKISPQRKSEDIETPSGFEVHRYDEEKVDEEKALPSTEPSDFIKRPVGEVEKVDHHEIEAARPVKYEYLNKRASGPTRTKAVLIFVGGFIFFTLMAVAADLLVTHLNIRVGVPAEEVQKQVDITVEKDRSQNDFDKAIIQGTQISKEKDFEVELQSTGEKEAGEKAKGILTFKNDAGVDVTIDGGTTIRSTSGVEFVLDGTITVPKAQLNSAGDKVLGQTTGSVTAKNPGAAGNMPASTTYVISSQPKISISGATSGGVTKKIKVVSKADIDQAKKQLKEIGTDELSKPAESEKELIFLEGAGTTEITDFSTSKNVSDEADSFTAKAHIKFTTLAFKSSDFRQAVVRAVEKELNDKSLLFSDTDVISPTLKENQINIGKLVVTGSLNSHIGPKIDTKQLLMSWRLKPLKKVRSSLENIEGAEIREIDLTPKFALPLAPVLTRNINLKLEYIQK